MFWHFIGSVAATLTMFSFIPQIIKINNNKSAKDISLVTITQLSAGVFLWLVYGIYLKNFIIITANSVTLTTLAIILILYFKYEVKKMKKAFITGITGQDGSYLAEFLLEKGYEVHGMIRRVALEDPEHRLWRIRHIQDKLVLHSASLESYASVFNTLAKVKPDECYHLAAQSFVSYSFEDEFSTINTNINGTHFLLSAIKEIVPECKFYFAGSSEMFGLAKDSPQNESTPFHPRSPYGISKVAGFDLTRNYREAYGLFACNGILFNHESPRRGFEFVTRKITSGVAKIKKGLAKELKLGNLDAKRDWGFAGDFVEAMWLMLQQDKPDDYVIATGESYSVRDFVNLSFDFVGLPWQDYIVIDEKLYRPSEVHELKGDYSKAKKTFNWKPKKKLTELVEMMIKEDLSRF